MALPTHKTKIVCTIGPASESPQVLAQMIRAGMDVARINFSHGDFSAHQGVIANIRASSRAEGKRVAIMADLPGPKMRIGRFKEEPVALEPGNAFTLTTESITGDQRRVSITFSRLPEVTKAGDRLFLNDGLIQLEVESVAGTEVNCRVVVGGDLRSRKGLNVPGIDLGISAFTDHDRRCLQFALEQGVDAVSQSFVENAEDVAAVRSAARSLGFQPFVIAKVERSRALDHVEDILDAADGIMIARGDLGVEIPIEQIALVQKQLVRRANLKGKPVITATQMLESMTDNPRPTRAEATDVANAILDGTDCVMLSGESAMGKYPVETVAMLAKIAAAIEPHRPSRNLREKLESFEHPKNSSLKDLIALSVETIIERSTPAAVFVPTHGGATARSITRFRLPVWVVAVSSREATCQHLQFSYGVLPVYDPLHPDEWRTYVRSWLQDQGIDGTTVILTEGPSSKHPEINDRVELIDLARPDCRRTEEKEK